MSEIKVVRDANDIAQINLTDNTVFGMDVENFLDSLPEEQIFDLVVTSPPYNIGKEYETRVALEQYIAWQKRIIEKIYIRLKDTGSICWQVGNYVDNGAIIPFKSSALSSVSSLPKEIQSSAKSFFKGGSNHYNIFSVEKLSDGNYQIKMENPGRVPGSKAVYYKIVDSEGRTVRVYKETYDPNGNLVHVKEK